VSPQAFIISPVASFEIAGAIAAQPDHYQMSPAAGLVACRLLREAIVNRLLVVPERELPWLERMETTLQKLTTENTLL
jgi:hypothetical protein